MKYLVNRETKEHKVYSGTEFYDDEAWRVVDADDEGWIKWDGPDGVNPLPDNCQCNWITKNWKSADQSPHMSSILGWTKGITIAYRPIFPAESTPTLEETWHAINEEAKVDVFTRLAYAVISAEAIPALIAEINAMLPEGYEVTRK